MQIKDSENKIFSYPGVIHIHSKFSDGTGDIDEITKAAKKAGLFWVLITDHNNMDIKEGFYNGVSVLVGEEISPKSENHYLALGINNLIAPSDNAGLFIEEVRAQGGFGFVAHPDESDSRNNKAHPIKWLDKSLDVDGIEIWNWFSDWADNYDERNIFKIAYAYFFRHKLIKGPRRVTLNWWDELNLKNDKIIPAIGGADAHALKVSKYIIPLKIFPYESCFKTLNNILMTENPLTDDFEKNKEIILNSIKCGNNIILNQRYSKSGQFPQFEVLNGFKKAYCGQTINLNENTYLHIKLVQKADIKVFHNGEEIYSAKASQLTLKLEKIGKYRIETKYKNNPWIYSNPILVK